MPAVPGASVPHARATFCSSCKGVQGCAGRAGAELSRASESHECAWSLDADDLGPDSDSGSDSGRRVGPWASQASQTCQPASQPHAPHAPHLGGQTPRRPWSHYLFRSSQIMVSARRRATGHGPRPYPCVASVSRVTPTRTDGRHGAQSPTSSLPRCLAASPGSPWQVLPAAAPAVDHGWSFQLPGWRDHRMAVNGDIEGPWIEGHREMKGARTHAGRPLLHRDPPATARPRPGQRS